MWYASQEIPPPRYSARIGAPLASACSNDSNTRTPAPSPIKNPSRPLSHGREASSGASLRRDNALQAQKPARPIGNIGASTPPQIIISASPA